jgi:hypothetical protein
MLRQKLAQQMDADSAVKLTARALQQRSALEPSACLWATQEFVRVLGYVVTQTPEDVASVQSGAGQSTSDPPRWSQQPPTADVVVAPPDAALSVEAVTQFVAPPAAPVTATYPLFEGPQQAPASTRPVQSKNYLLAGLLAAVIVVGGAVAAVALTRGNGHPATTVASPGKPVTPTPRPPPEAPGRTAALSIDKLIAQSSSARPMVQSAINGVISCNTNPKVASAQVEQAITVRQNVITSLQGLNVAGLPNGGLLVADLSKAMTDSVIADRYYQAWMADELRADQCVDPGQNTNYIAGNDSSKQATADKQQFIGIWNPVAASFALHQYQEGDF